MRDAFSTTLVQLAKADPKILLLTGDHGYALFDEFRRECPDQYINAGIAEQNMVGMAAGLARLGFRPFVYGLSAFVPVRVLEQIKLDIAHDNLPVVLLGDGAGFVYSHLGTSHQSTEDIACARAVPRLRVMSPADAIEMRACMHAAYAQKTAIYLRMGKSDRGQVHSNQVQLDITRPINVHETDCSTVAIFATGSMVRNAIDIAKERGDTTVWSVPSIKPLAKSEVLEIAEKHRLIVTLEEHSIYGGMGSAVAEMISESIPRKIKIIGVEDRFSEHCGTYDYLLRENGLQADQVAKKIHDFVMHN